jgi:hypothetical protein
LARHYFLKRNSDFFEYFVIRGSSFRTCTYLLNLNLNLFLSRHKAVVNLQTFQKSRWLKEDDANTILVHLVCGYILALQVTDRADIFNFSSNHLFWIVLTKLMLNDSNTSRPFPSNISPFSSSFPSSEFLTRWWLVVMI